MKKRFKTNKISTKKIIIAALLSAITCVVTFAIRVPVPATQGYINIGDSIIFLCGALLGPVIGFVAGGLGSCLADVFSGYVFWAPFTLIIKGLEGFVTGIIVYLAKKFNLNKYLFAFIAMLLGGIVCITGYFIASVIIYRSAAAAWFGVIGDLIQISVSLVLGMLLTVSISNINGIEKLIGENNLPAEAKKIKTPKLEKNKPDDVQSGKSIQDEYVEN